MTQTKSISMVGGALALNSTGTSVIVLTSIPIALTRSWLLLFSESIAVDSMIAKNINLKKYTTMKIKCQYCGREYIVSSSSAIVKGAFCCLACELAWAQSRKGYPG